MAAGRRTAPGSACACSTGKQAWRAERLLFGIALQAQLQRLLCFATIGDPPGMRRHRRAGDFHHLWSVAIYGQRYPVIEREIGRLLTVRPAQEVESEPVVC